MYSDVRQAGVSPAFQTAQGLGAAVAGKLEPPSGVTSAFTAADQAAEMVLQAVAALRDRLENGGALRPSSPSGQADSAKQLQEPVSGIAGRLRDQYKRLEVARDVLVDIHNRLDL